MQQKKFTRAMLVTMLASVVLAMGCKVEDLSKRQQQKDAKKNDRLAVESAVTAAPTPTTDNAAAVIAACGQASSDQVVNINDRTESGPVRRLVYSRGLRQTTLDFLPLQTNSSSGHAATSSNTIWRFNQALVDNQRLLTAANIKVYLPCAANALAKEF